MRRPRRRDLHHCRCPECAQSYGADGHALDDDGRNVNCLKCGAWNTVDYVLMCERGEYADMANDRMKDEGF